jgi:sporulation protein YlmC with PRC-barrel domain
MTKEFHMINIPAKAEVYCADGIAGRSTYIIGNPTKDEITNLVVQSNRPPFRQYVVPIDQLDVTSDGRIKLKCSLEDLHKMDPFESEEYIRTELPGYLRWEDVPAIPGFTTEPAGAFIPVKHRNISQDELALRRGARVDAIDGHVGEVDELLIDSEDMQVTHLVMLVKHPFDKSKIKIPVSQIDHISEDTIYLKLAKHSVEELLTALV